MSYASYQQAVAAEASVNERVDFIRKTYLHLGGAVLACVGLTGALLNSEVGQRMALSMLRGSWMLVLVLFMVAGYVAERWSRSLGSPTKQYMGLALYVVAESVILLPLLFIAQMKAAHTGANIIGTAGLLTGVVFGGLTATVFITKKDFSFMGQMLSLLTWGAMGFILVSLLFGFNLGNLFAGAMVVLAGGYVLFYTSNILRNYPIGSHVAASLALFSAVALLFWYILQLVISFAGDD